MSTSEIIEIVGYIGSFIVLVSFLMTSVFKLRVINTVGSVIFTVYALLIHSYPTAIMNLCLALINIHFLWKMRHTGPKYSLVKVRPDDLFLQHLLANVYDDILKFFPGIKLSSEQEEGTIDRCYIVLCGNEPAGITLGKDKEDGVFEAVLDYSYPAYRDFSIGRYLLGKLREENFSKVIYCGPDTHHHEYLDKLGFVGKSGVYEREI